MDIEDLVLARRSLYKEINSISLEPRTPITIVSNTIFYFVMSLILLKEPRIL